MYSAKSHSVSRLSRLAAAAGVILATGAGLHAQFAQNLPNIEALRAYPSRNGVYYVPMVGEEYELTFQYRVSRMSVPSFRLNHM